MSILNSHFLMHAHHNFTSFVILYICLSKYKPYRAYVTNLIYSTINKVCLSVCLTSQDSLSDPGDTINEIVMDFSSRCFPHSHHMALSRVRTLDGLHIRVLHEKAIHTSEMVET